MITSAQIKEYFASLGIALPDFMIDCITEKVNTVEPCMTSNNYAACDITMSLLIASGLIGISMGARKVTSHKADIVSQGYQYDSIEDLQDILTNNLSQFDPNGCTNSVIPVKKNASFLFTVKGCASWAKLVTSPESLRVLSGNC